MSNVVIVGAGPAGLAASTRLGELGVQSLVIEKEHQIGGMARSIQLWGHTVDVGPHRFFSADPVIIKFWHRYMQGDHVLIARQTRIFYKNKYFEYPLKILNALIGLGFANSLKAVLSYIRVRLQPKEEDGTLENWVTNRFGRVLFQHFFKTYTEKLWGISCKELSADWAAQRIQKLTLWSAMKSAVLKNRGNSHKTLVDEFAYPAKGNSQFYERLSEAIVKFGSVIKTGTQINSIQVSDNKIQNIELSDGLTVQCQWLVSSMPITQLIQLLPEVPVEVANAASMLRFRNTICVYLLLNTPTTFSDQWLYIHDEKVSHGRITNFRNWSPMMIGAENETVLCIEFWCFNEDEIWSEFDQNLIDLARREIVMSGLIAEEVIVDGSVIRVPRCYPVYEGDYQSHLNIISEYLSTIRGLLLIGRYGSFKYNNQDHSLLMGILAAEGIVSGNVPDLWAVNTDSVYQESGDTKLFSP
jgi:protoporphyrinogen oxidase